MSEGAWVRSTGMKWNEQYQAWENAWSGSMPPGALVWDGVLMNELAGGWSPISSSQYTQGTLTQESNYLLFDTRNTGGIPWVTRVTNNSINFGNYAYVNIILSAPESFSGFGFFFGSMTGYTQSAAESGKRIATFYHTNINYGGYLVSNINNIQTYKAPLSVLDSNNQLYLHFGNGEHSSFKLYRVWLSEI